ncbi:6-phosphogluconolactonase [Stigmatella aurantiaca]|uniref:6-phosphogluconolactonase n=1 Tax=Stigmatella aurantiaca TaxID=41 RepID=A0A1H7FHZ4_STIAU|nr:lactonase family protein [Stigmatella aurantiaca]SEK24867.1 6-phosphogluconolactonase [Stigmatella aurantiaca]
MSKTKLTRRGFLRLSGLGMAAVTLPEGLGFDVTPFATPSEYYLYVGSYTSAGGEGITLCRLSMQTGSLQKVAVTRNVSEPSFLAMDRQGRYLYAVNELGSYQGMASGAVSAFAVNPSTRALTLINQQASRGSAPCFVSVDANDKFVMAANYGGGNISVFPIQSHGGLGAATDFKQFQGSGPHPNQRSPHAHQLMTNASNQYALAADLGTDRVMIYRFDAALGKLTATTPASFSTQPGAGPRHFAFHPSGKFVFVINELNSTLLSLAFDATQGTLTQVQGLSTLPAGYTGTSYCAEVRVSPDGKFVYGSNRGHNSIAVFAVDSLGKLTLVQHVSTQGLWPRDFILDPTGTYLLVANQQSHTIVPFRRDPVTGKLTALGTSLAVTAPTSLLVAPTPA